MRLRGRQIIALVLSATHLSGCTDAPTTAGSGSGPGGGAEAPIVFVDAQGQVNRIERTRLASGATRVVWTVAGEPAAELLAHHAADGSVQRITGTVQAGGYRQEIDQRYENGRPAGLSPSIVGPALAMEDPGAGVGGYDPGGSGDPCTNATIALAVAAAALVAAVATGMLPAILLASLAYAAALQLRNSYCLP